MAPLVLKPCGNCGVEKPLASFARNGHAYRSDCKACHNGARFEQYALDTGSARAGAPISGMARAYAWTAMVFDLERAGMTQDQIGRACGVQGDSNPSVWVNRLKNIPGTQPKFLHGARLLALWIEVTGRSVVQAPIDG